MKTSFSQWKNLVMRLAKRQKAAYRVPGDNDLFVLWEHGIAPETVIEKHLRPDPSK
jgi:hypothetical protein